VFVRLFFAAGGPIGEVARLDSSASAPAEEGPAPVEGPDIESDDNDVVPGARLLFRGVDDEEGSALAGVLDVAEWLTGSEMLDVVSPSCLSTRLDICDSIEVFFTVVRTATR